MDLDLYVNQLRDKSVKHLECLYCNEIISKVNGNLFRHAKRSHGCESSEAYYQKFLLQDDEDKCIICGGKNRFSTVKYNYPTTCGQKCQLKTDNFKQKREKTMMEKYGVIVPLKNKKLDMKRKQTMVKKYGVESMTQIEEKKQEMLAKRRITDGEVTVDNQRKRRNRVKTRDMDALEIELLKTNWEDDSDDDWQEV